jgi:hypothetical protein
MPGFYVKTDHVLGPANPLRGDRNLPSLEYGRPNGSSLNTGST